MTRLRRCEYCDSPVEWATLAVSGERHMLDPPYPGVGGQLEIVEESDDGKLVVRLASEERRRELRALGRARLRVPHRWTCLRPDLWPNNGRAAPP